MNIMRAKFVTFGLAIAAACSVCIGLAAIRGVVGISRDDDWSYLATVMNWTFGPVPDLNGWVHMMFVAQGSLGAILTRAFGESLVLLQMTTLVLGIVGLVAVSLLARWVLPNWEPLLVLLLTGFSPLWLHLSVTYMTDIPAWAFSALSIALGVAAVTKQRSGLLAVGTCVGLLGFGVREYAIVPFVALLVWVIFSEYPKRFRLWSLGLGIFSVVVCALTYKWRQSLPGAVDTEPMAPLESLAVFARLLLTLALFLAPYGAIALVVIWSRRGRVFGALRTYSLGVSVGAVLAIGLAILASFQLAGNVIHPYGSSWTSVGDGVRSLPLWGFRVIVGVGVLSLVALLALVGMLVQRRIAVRVSRAPGLQGSSSLVSLYVFISGIVMAVYCVAIFVAGAPAFDRYLLLVVPILGITILWLGTRCWQQRITKLQKAAVAGILVVSTLFGIFITDGLNQVDGLRWQVATELVASGIPAYKIDGGDSWFRYHQMDAPGVAQVGSLENSIPGRTWWQTFFEGSAFCRMVAIESETDLQAVYGPALSVQEERTLIGTPFRVMVFPGPDPC